MDRARNECSPEATCRHTAARIGANPLTLHAAIQRIPPATREVLLRTDHVVVPAVGNENCSQTGSTLL